MVKTGFVDWRPPAPTRCTKMSCLGADLTDPCRFLASSLPLLARMLSPS